MKKVLQIAIGLLGAGILTVIMAARSKHDEEIPAAMPQAGVREPIGTDRASRGGSSQSSLPTIAPPTITPPIADHLKIDWSNAPPGSPDEKEIRRFEALVQSARLTGVQESQLKQV